MRSLDAFGLLLLVLLVYWFARLGVCVLMDSRGFVGVFVVLWWLGIYFVAGSGFWILIWFGIVREFRFARVLIYVGDCSCCVVCLCWLLWFSGLAVLAGLVRYKFCVLFL